MAADGFYDSMTAEDCLDENRWLDVDSAIISAKGWHF